jgi:hypothetical protein
VTRSTKTGKLTLRYRAALRHLGIGRHHTGHPSVRTRRQPSRVYEGHVGRLRHAVAVDELSLAA